MVNLSRQELAVVTVVAVAVVVAMQRRWFGR
jgi:hypothetical protein